MVMANEDVVQIQGGQKPGDPFVVTINCPDKTGLGCDLCRIILEFGLSITRAGSILASNFASLFYVFSIFVVLQICKMHKLIVDGRSGIFMLLNFFFVDICYREFHHF